MIKKYIGAILLFGLIFTMMLFSFLFIKNLYGDYLIKPIAEKGLSINTDNVTNTAINETISWYDQWVFPFDTFFLIMWISIDSFLIYSAIQSVKLPAFDFTSILFFGMLIIMFIFNFINQITQWFYIQFIGNVFSSDLIYFPIYNFYMQNHAVIVFLTIIITLLLNQLLGKEKIIRSGV